MKAGDIVVVYDGSWSMSVINGSLEHVNGNDLLGRRFRVLDTGGVYPADAHSCHPFNAGQPNNTMLVDVNDSNHVLFIQQAFCCAATSVPPTPHDTVDVTIPPGVKTVKLHLEH